MNGEKKSRIHGYYYPIDKEAQMINLIKSGNKSKVMALINNIFYINTNEYILSKELFELLKYDIQCTMTKIICDIIKESEFHTVEDFLFLKNISSSADFDELKQALYDAVENVLDNFHKITKNSLVSKVVDYVEDNYTIPDLSVSIIADFFNVHISYLSTTFKKHMGTGLTEHIQSVRISKAKILLKNSNKKITEVANDVGYFSLHTFVRVFKNCEGLTPAKYRQIKN